MRNVPLWTLLILTVAAMQFPMQSSHAQLPDPPRAKKIPHPLTTHDQTRDDEYYWLNQRENPDVISYLNQENEYTAAAMADVQDLEKKLFDEIVARIKQDDQSVPYTDRGFVYYTRFNEGQQYPIYCRRADQPDATEQIMLDVNRAGRGQTVLPGGGGRGQS